MGQVIHIHSQRIFTEGEASELLPVVKRITERAAARIDELKARLEWLPEGEPSSVRLKGKLEFELKRWILRISQLGCEPRGIWLVDFKADDGWFSWRYGDDSLNFFDSRRRSAGLADSHCELPS
jgi:hypothetical protein